MINAQGQEIVFFLSDQGVGRLNVNIRPDYPRLFLLRALAQVIEDLRVQVAVEAIQCPRQVIPVGVAPDGIDLKGGGNGGG
jgi:hypothetical protein